MWFNFYLLMRNFLNNFWFWVKWYQFLFWVLKYKNLEWFFIYIYMYSNILKGLSCGSAVENLPAMQEMGLQSLDLAEALEEGMATHSSILAWEILWTEEPGGLQYMGLQRVRNDWIDSTHKHVKSQFACTITNLSTQVMWFNIGQISIYIRFLIS